MPQRILNPHKAHRQVNLTIFKVPCHFNTILFLHLKHENKHKPAENSLVHQDTQKKTFLSE